MDVFVYGTLTDPDRAGSVLDGDFEYGPPATLVGLRRVDGRYPTLAPPAEDGAGSPPGDTTSVEGRILRTDRIGALDEYEAVGRGLYVRVTLPLDGDGVGDDRGVEVYVGDPEELAVDDVTWPGAGEFDGRVRRYVGANAVVVVTEG